MARKIRKLLTMLLCALVFATIAPTALANAGAAGSLGINPNILTKIGSMAGVGASDEASTDVAATARAKAEMPVVAGDPTPTETPAVTEAPAQTEMPAETVAPAETEAPAETPSAPVEPKIAITATVEGGILAEGAIVTLHAEIIGVPADVGYSLQWQNDLTGEFADVAGETGDSVTFAATAENIRCSWRVALTLEENTANDAAAPGTPRSGNFAKNIA